MSEELIKERAGQLAKFYQKHNPEKIGDAESLVRDYPFLSIVASLDAKYGKEVMYAELPTWMAELQKQQEIEARRATALQNNGAQPEAKKPRVEEPAPPPPTPKLIDLGEDLQEMLGREDCNEHELVPLLMTTDSVKMVATYLVNVLTLGGKTFSVKLYEGHNQVEQLKKAIQVQYGMETISQQLFLLRQSSSDPPPSDAPLLDADPIERSCSLVLCINLPSECKWDQASPLIATKQFEITGKNNTIAMKIGSLDYNNCFMASDVMEGGKHRVSFKLVKGEGRYLDIYCGLAKEGAATDEDHGQIHGVGAWYLATHGRLYGNGKVGNNNAGKIHDGEVVSMEADLDAGTLKYWVNGKKRGPGHTNGVTGRVKWAVMAYWKGNYVQIVPTPADLDIDEKVAEKAKVAAAAVATAAAAAATAAVAAIGGAPAPAASEAPATAAATDEAPAAAAPAAAAPVKVESS